MIFRQLCFFFQDKEREVGGRQRDNVREEGEKSAWVGVVLQFLPDEVTIPFRVAVLVYSLQM